MGFWERLRASFGRPSASTTSSTGGTGPDGAVDPNVARGPEGHFTALAERILRATPGVTAVRPLPEEFAIDYEFGGHPSKLFLHNTFVETRDMGPEERAARLRFVIAATQERDDAPEAWEAAVERLVPLVRAATFTSAIPEGARAIASKPLLPFTTALLGIDSDTSFRYATLDDLARWGVTFDEAFAAACSTLAAHHRDEHVESYDRDAPYPIWHVGFDDSYQSSRLLLPGWLASFEGRVKGRPIAAIPYNAALIVTGDGDERAVERLARTADNEFRASPRSISPALYTVDEEGRVVPFHVRADHAAAAAVAKGHLILAGTEYATQKGALEAKFERDGTDIFVASLTIVARDGALPVSYAVWTEGVDSMLPEADALAFVPQGSDSKPWLVRWGDVLELVGADLKAVPDLYPRRLRTIGWPDAAKLGALRERAVEVAAI